jgi:Flp pilus assembly protein TadD
MERKDYPAAIKAYGEALAKRPQDTLASSKLKQAEAARAKQSSHDRHVAQAKKHMETKSYSQAEMELQAVLQDVPGDREAQGLLRQMEANRRQDKVDYDRAMTQGDLAMTRNDYPAAIKAYGKALARKPQDGSASSKLRQGETIKAKKDSYDQHLNQAKAQLKLKNYPSVERELEAAFRDMPGDRDAQQLMRQMIANRRQDQADYERALTQGDTAMTRKDYPGAIKAYGEALAKKPQDGTATSKLGQAQAARAKKDSYDQHMKQGKLQLQRKNYRMAETEFRAAGVDMPGDPDAQQLVQEAARQGKR